MSLALSVDQVEEERRARKLEAAKKKLKTFRATRTPSASTSTSSHSQNASSSSAKSLGSRSPRLGILPLTTENGGNVSTYNRANSKGKGKMADGMLAESSLSGLGGQLGMGHERIRSGAKASGRHRRQNSSISAPAHSLHRPAPIFDHADEDRAGQRMSEYKFNLPVPREITMTPATPLLETNELSDPFSFVPSSAPLAASEEDVGAVKQRLSAFSFGSKPSLSPLSPSRSPSASPNRRQRLHSSPNPPLLPSVALRAQDLNFPPSPFLLSEATSAPANLDKLASGTPSRPPSLLFTNATPLLPSPSAPNRLTHASHPSLAGIAGLDSPSPSTPPTPARKRHSHTRSNSISLSALKLGGPRPTSLGIPSSPSFPSSPGSPNSPDDGSKPTRTPISGTRLKFEPSEAEMAKEESRRKALEKLNGTSPAASPILDEPIAEISLPDLEDDTSSTTSSSRPLSGAWASSSSSSSSSFSFGRPNSLNASPAGYVHNATPAMEPSLFPAWPADDAVPMSFDRWSSEFREESLGFGMEMLPKRGSFQGGLAVLPEVEETEEEMETEEEATEDEVPPAVAQTPMASAPSSGLRELHLLSSGPIGTPMRPTLSTDSASSLTRSIPRLAPISPTKGYGTIGRGRPRPLSGINAKSSISTSGSGSTSSPLTTSVITPTTARMSAPRRRLSGSSRRSSISYKKDKDASATDVMSAGSSFSSRWSINSRSMVSPPPTELSLASPPLPSPRQSSNWAHIPRSANRPCPRPKSLVGLGIQSQSSGSNRVLSEVLEKDEGDELGLSLGLGDGWAAAPTSIDRGFTFKAFGSGSVDLDLAELEVGRRSMESQGGERWRDGLLEVEMERDALREDVDGWRERCRGLEERLEDEKRESGVLRERMRKLSDRLLTLSTTPHSPARAAPAAQDSRLVGEMKDQLFSLTSAYERERREKEAALQRVAQLEAQLVERQADVTPSWSFSPYSPPSTFETQQQTFGPALVPSQSPQFPQSPQLGGTAYPWPSTPIVTPATPAMVTPDHSALFASPPPPPKHTPAEPESSPPADLNGYRMRAWGFPSARPAPTSPAPATRQSKRESFFGLSKVPQQAVGEMVETEMYDAGVDLPPFILPGLSAPPIIRAVSDPVLSPTRGFASLYPAEPGSLAMAKSASASSFSTSAFSLISGYLPGRSSSPTKKTSELYTHHQSSEIRRGEGVGGVPDMTFACRCCVGDVLEF